ncbi:GNAT superfamily N-acetyltransferase [Ancylobacter sp. 3268]|uniref:GNAT family N-acetyltransferase n=1 Tax=Ancylobacter sp. 3268 TaxID=2817752 RepID=UPI002861A1AD|nr:GNAT family N-acetyltransferase [Ancylobacter sp. 3268]MDR6951768.1 GNAT superfamily N-acetyltransferase [Ancylobacter sp. 3268]
MRIAIESDPDSDVRALIDRGLDIYNNDRAGAADYRDLWAIARDGNGAAGAGLKARTFYRWMFIDWLWVSDDARGRGLGRALLAEAEAEARHRDCLGAFVDTYSFQAPEFYEKQGYQRFGQIDDFPPGHACIWLKKVF